ncbi:MAG TPA: BON domain-containing protein [Magnetovibrio sp.]
MRLTTVTSIVAILLSTAPAHAIDINPFGYIKDAVEAVVEDRLADDIAKDTEIKAKIFAAVTDQMGTDMLSFSTDVYEQDVMLTGVVENGKLKTQAEAIARGVAGVKKIYNEVLVIPKIKQKGMVEGFVEDTVIEKKINALLLDAKGVSVTNYRWRSVGGHVFLFGRALSKAELKKAISVVKGIENVTQVTDRVKIKAK